MTHPPPPPPPHPRTTVHLCVLQPVVEAAVWVLRAVLTVAPLVLAPAHALCVHLLPDLTQLAILHTSRNAIAAPLPVKAGAGVRNGVGAGKGDKAPATAPVAPFHAVRAQQFVDAVQAVEASGEDAMLPIPWSSYAAVCVCLLVLVAFPVPLPLRLLHPGQRCTVR